MSSQQNMFSCLWHRTIICCNNQYCTVHLSCTSNHVLYVVSVSRAVNVSVMSLFRFVFNVGCSNRNSSCLFFRSFINLIKSCKFSLSFQRQSLSNGSCQSCFSVVNMPYSPNIKMGFSSFVPFFCHGYPP